MTKFGGAPVIYDLNPYSTSTVQMHPLGARAETDDGRKFRYAKAVAATAAGYSYSSAPQDSQFQSMAVNAIEPIGEKTIGITLGTTTVTAGMFVEGYALISYATGIGQFGKIVNHGTGTSGEAINITLDRPLETALSVTSKVTIVQNPYYNVVIQATTPVAPVVGLAMNVIGAGEYGWVATGGPAMYIPDAGANTSVDTLGLAPSTTTAGCLAVQVEANNMMVGFAMQVVSVNAYGSPCFLTID